jgi:DNA invertase Pin-like site-specific DNA recombinase
VAANERKILRCAVYTRKSSEHGLEQDFNSLDAQREAGEAYIKSQAHEGWKLIKTHYDDGGQSGGTLERPALQSLLADIQARKIDVVVVYKVDRLTRSLADFAKLVELFEAHGASFVSVTQQFNTTTSMGRLTLNVLLSFAQFEREVAGERIRDKFAASRRKGMWMGGTIPLGYEVKDRKLIVNEAEAETVRLIFRQYLALGCVSKLRAELDRMGVRSKQRVLTSGQVLGGCSFGRGALYHLLRNRIYRGEVAHKGIAYPGEHNAIVDEELWNAVQAKLSGDVVRQRRARIESGALLGGLIFDDRGNRMTPTYTMRRGNRYRYYVSRALMQQGGQETSAVPRVGADDIERLVVETLSRALSRKDLALDAGSGIWNTETRTVVRESVERVVVGGEESQIVLKGRAGEAGTGTPERDGDDTVTVLTVPLPPARPRARRTILLPGDAGSAPRRIDQALLLALAQARSWVRGLRHGEYANTAEIARRFDLSEPHVRRLLRFAYLAPDMVEAIVEGRQPRTLTVRLLLRGIPLAWTDQRAALGFTHQNPERIAAAGQSVASSTDPGGAAMAGKVAGTHQVKV